ncbi:MAG: response regulator transcription factor [Burkholderiales bacterium]
MQTEGENRPIALVVEDAEQSASLLRSILEREGYKVALAHDGDHAQRLVGVLEPPALVMLDVLLPYVDGFRLLSLMREKTAWKNVPIVMLTGKSQEKDIVRALEAGANDYIVKPFHLDELRARIKRLVKRDT